LNDFVSKARFNKEELQKCDRSHVSAFDTPVAVPISPLPAARNVSPGTHRWRRRHRFDVKTCHMASLRHSSAS